MIPFITAIASAIAAFWLSLTISEWLRVDRSHFEGASILLAIVCAIAGAVVGLLAGLLSALLPWRFLPRLGASLAMVAAVLGVIALHAWNTAPDRGTADVDIEAEVRFPPGFSDAAVRQLNGSFVLRSGGVETANRGIDVSRAKEVDDRMVAPARLPMLLRGADHSLWIHEMPAAKRHVAVRLSDQLTDWSQWLDLHDQSGRPDGYQLRFRVVPSEPREPQFR